MGCLPCSPECLPIQNVLSDTYWENTVLSLAFPLLLLSCLSFLEQWQTCKMKISFAQILYIIVQITIGNSTSFSEEQQQKTILAQLRMSNQVLEGNLNRIFGTVGCILGIFLEFVGRNVCRARNPWVLKGFCFLLCWFTEAVVAEKTGFKQHTDTSLASAALHLLLCPSLVTKRHRLFCFVE